MSRRDWIALAVILLATAALVAFRLAYIEPREWGALCTGANPPAACLPRTGLIFLQHYGLWGLGALALGLWALFGAPFATGPAAVALGIAAVINYNATWGMLGAALGAWTWIRQAGRNGKQARAAKP
jgi:hypothetical protein